MVALAKKIKTLETTTHETLEKTRENFNDGFDTAHEKVSDMAVGAARTEATWRQRTRELSERAKEGCSTAATRTKEGLDELAERTKTAGRSTDQWVRTHPAQALGVSAALGLAAGVLIARRRRTPTD